MTTEEYGLQMRRLEEQIRRTQQKLSLLYQEQEEIRSAKAGLNQMLERHAADCALQRQALNRELLNGNAALRGFRDRMQHLLSHSAAGGKESGALQSVAELSGRQQRNEQTIETLRLELESLNQELNACAQARLRAISEAAEEL